MGRFSPTVLPEEGPSFIENLANAFQLGMGSFEQTRRRKDARTERDRQISRETDQDAIQGIHPAGWTPPLVEGEIQENDVGFDERMPEGPGFGFPQEEPVVEGPRSASGHPGGWDPVTRQFAKVPPRFPPPVTLPSGRVHDPSVQMRARLAQAMLEAEGEAGLKETERVAGVTRRRGALGGLQGQKGFEHLTPALMDAAAQDESLYESTVKNEPRAWRPGTMAEALTLHGAQAEQSAAATAKHRAPRAATDPKKQLMTRLQDVVSGAIALEKKDGVTEPTDQNAAARALNIIGADPELRPLFDSGKITRDLVWQAVQRYRDSRTLRGKEEEDASWLEDPAPKTSSGRPAANATRPLPAPDDVLDEIDQQYGGDEQKIRTELKRRGFDPDA